MSNKAIIIGAGVSGLTAANILCKQGYEVQILEKNSHAGGRLTSHTFADGSKAELGGMFIHDTSHPVARLFSKGGDRHNLEEFNQNQAMNAEGMLELQVNLKEFFLSKKNTIYNLSYRQLLEKMINISEDDSEDLQEIAAIFNSEPLSSLLNIQDGNLEDAVHLLQRLDVDVDRTSILGSQYYLGEENGAYIPNEGYSKVADYLLDKAITAGVGIKYNTYATKVDSDKSLTLHDGTEISADMIVVAIAPFQYEKIEFNLSTSKQEELATAISNLVPSGSAKIAINLNQPLPEKVNTAFYSNQVNQVITHEDGSSYYEELSCNLHGNKGSNILYAFYNGKSFSPEQVEPALKEMIANLQSQGMLTQDTEISDVKFSYTDGNSWYNHEVGFMPVDNSGDIKFIGTVTGSDDSVHSVISAACDSLTDDMQQCLGDLFAEADSF